MTLEQATKQLVFEMIQLTGHFEDSEVYTTYITRAIVFGMEHLSPKMKEIVALDFEGKEVGRFKTVRDAAKQLKLSQGNIYGVLEGKRHSLRKMTFIRAKDWDHK